MKRWFKLTDTTVMSLKWQRMARKLGVSPAVVSFVYVAVLSSASQCDDGGSIEGFDPEDVDFFGGFKKGTTAKILEAFTHDGLISKNGGIVDWDEFVEI